MKSWIILAMAATTLAPAQDVAAPRLRAVVGTAAAAPASAPTTTPVKVMDTLEFLSGDVLRGTFLSFESTGIKWRHDGIRETITAVPANVRSVRLVTRPRPQNLPKPNSRVMLTNGDRLAGTLVRMDETTLELDTWYASKLALPRSALRNVVIVAGRGDLVFEGLTGLEGWTAAAGRNVFFGGEMAAAVPAEVVVNMEDRRGGGGEIKAWQFKDGALVATNAGTIGRDLKLPPASNIEFDLETMSYPQFTLYFYTEAVDKTYSINALALQFSSRYVYLRRHLRNGSSRSVSSSESTLGPGGKTKAHISIRTDLERRLVMLFIDDALVRKWTDLGDANLEGTGVMFQQSGTMPTRIANLQVSKWDGSLDDLNAPGASSKEDLAVMKNGDKVSGQIMGIQSEVLRFKTAFAELQVPVERINWLQFATRATTNAEPGTVRLQFFDQGSVTLKLERWDDLQVAGAHPLFGPVKFQPSAFIGMQIIPPASNP